MTTLRDYYEKDFRHCLRVSIKFPFQSILIEGAILYDFTGFLAFMALYIPEKNRDAEFFANLLSELRYGTSKFRLDSIVNLPRPSSFPGVLQIENKEIFEVIGRFYSDNEWISTNNFQSSKRVFIYSETNLATTEIDHLKIKAKEFHHELIFRDEKYTVERDKLEKPLAFISYDSRDRNDVAQKIALGLQKMLCTVWYDKFSLKVGDNLRESIEKGLKECKKCILVLSPNFITNSGWTKTEFDSIFTRQILEEKKLILPVWWNIGKNDVYNYSPSLLNIMGLNWNELGEDEVCRRLFAQIMN